MKKVIKYSIIIMAVLLVVKSSSSNAYAWGDSDGGRPSYTIDDINNRGVLGPAGVNAKNQKGYPGKIIFNTISNSVIGNEHNFVGARENTGINAGANNVWEGNKIQVEDGKTYIIRLYVHNNNPNGTDATAEDVHVSFSIPGTSSRSVEVNGFITSSNATPSKYWDYVDFISDVPFHLEYILGSALLENNGIGAGGLQLSDDIIAPEGILIGYDALDGRIPGCYQYDAFISVEVKAVYDYGFSVENELRILESEDDTWSTETVAHVEDTAEIRITYINHDEIPHSDVTLSSILPPGLEYEPQSTVLYTMNNGKITETSLSQDSIVVPEVGLNIGTYEPGAYAQIYFRVKVVDKGLFDGQNILINGAKARVDHVTLQSHATINVYTFEYLKSVFAVGLVGLMIFGLYRLFFRDTSA